MNDWPPRKAYYDSGELENFRLHIVMMAPSGFGKSTSYRMLLHPTRGMLSKVSIFGTTLRSTFTPESWIGTATKDGKDVVTKQGIFNRHKRDIVGADEFMRFVGMMDTQKVDSFSNEEVYLLTALDTDTATKDMSCATIEESGIGTTLWAGSRIASIDMKHGLARRVLFQIFIPTPDTCQMFRDSMLAQGRKKKISDSSKEAMNKAVVMAKNDLNSFDDLDYTQFYEYLKKYRNIPHFEINLLKRIAIGYSVARNTIPDIIMDESLLGLMHDEMNSRRVIRGNPEIEIVKRIIEESGSVGIKGDNLREFLSQWYQFTEQKIRNLLTTMGTYGIVEVRKDMSGKTYTIAKKRAGNPYAL